MKKPKYCLPLLSLFALSTAIAGEYEAARARFGSLPYRPLPLAERAHRYQCKTSYRDPALGHHEFALEFRKKDVDQWSAEGDSFFTGSLYEEAQETLSTDRWPGFIYRTVYRADGDLLIAEHAAGCRSCSPWDETGICETAARQCRESLPVDPRATAISGPREGGTPYGMSAPVLAIAYSLCRQRQTNVIY